MDNKTKIGFIGLGIMGMAMAKNVKSKGFAVSAYNRSKDKLDVAEKFGIDPAESPADLANQSDVIIIMVTDPKAVAQVLSGPKGVFEGEVKGKTLFQMSTIDEKSTLEFARQVESHGMTFLDCPVTGSKKQVEAAELILLAGGDEALIQKWEPVLLSMGKAIVHAGGIGKGSALKLCMNLLVAQMTTGLCESVALAKVQEISPGKIFEVLNHSPALNCSYFKIKEKALMEEDFSPAFSLANMLKDVVLMSDTAKQKRLGLPVLQAVRYIMEAAQHDGFGNQDLTVIAKLLKPHTQNKGGNFPS